MPPGERRFILAGQAAAQSMPAKGRTALLWPRITAVTPARTVPPREKVSSRIRSGWPRCGPARPRLARAPGKVTQSQIARRLMLLARTTTPRSRRLPLIELASSCQPPAPALPPDAQGCKSQAGRQLALPFQRSGRIHDKIFVIRHQLVTLGAGRPRLQSYRLNARTHLSIARSVSLLSSV